MLKLEKLRVYFKDECTAKGLLFQMTDDENL